MTVDPFAGDVLELRDRKDVYRRRVGDYRIFFRGEVTQAVRVIVVLEIARRTTTTYRKR